VTAYGWNGFVTNGVLHEHTKISVFSFSWLWAVGLVLRMCGIAIWESHLFAQVAWEKRWYFMDPKYFSYMRPLRGGLLYMMPGTL